MYPVEKADYKYEPEWVKKAIKMPTLVEEANLQEDPTSHNYSQEGLKPFVRPDKDGD